jgi:sugar-specific transcriptional regulator TrmB
MSTRKPGRPLKYAADDPNATERRTVTLRRRQIAAVQALQENEEEFSTTLQRLLDSHPAVATIADWIERTRAQTP